MSNIGVLFLVAAAPLSVPPQPEAGAHATPSLADGAVGAAYVVASSDTETALRVVFPMPTVRGLADMGGDPQRTVEISGPRWLDILDGAGVVGTIAAPEKYVVLSWCFNDGGIHFRPEVQVRVPNASLERKLRPIAEIGNLAAVVVARNARRPRPEAPVKPDGTVVLRGAADANSAPLALVWVSRTLAGCDDPPPSNDLDAMLRVGSVDSQLRCCGP